MRRFLLPVVVIAWSVVAAPPAHAETPDPYEFALTGSGNQYCALSSYVPDPPLPEGKSLFVAVDTYPGSTGSLPISTPIVV